MQSFDIKDYLKNPENYEVIINEFTGFCVVRKNCSMDHKLKVIAGYKAGLMGQGVDYTLKRYKENWQLQLEKRNADNIH